MNKEVLAKNSQYGVWCIEDRAWCQGSIGTLEHAEKELPYWISGEKADVDLNHFHYEVREYHECNFW